MCVSSPLELTVEGEKGRERKGGRDWESESGRAREKSNEDTRVDDEGARASATDILIFTHTHTQQIKGGETERRIHICLTFSRVA